MYSNFKTTLKTLSNLLNINFQLYIMFMCDIISIYAMPYDIIIIIKNIIII